MLPFHHCQNWKSFPFLTKGHFLRFNAVIYHQIYMRLKKKLEGKKEYSLLSKTICPGMGLGMTALLTSSWSQSNMELRKLWESCWTVPAKFELKLPTVDLRSNGRMDLSCEYQSCSKTWIKVVWLIEQTFGMFN